MSRIGRSPIAVPAGVEVALKDGNTVTVLESDFDSRGHGDG